MPAPLPPSRFHWVWTGLAVAIAVVWLWINFCRFPASSWNDIRLAPVFMAAAGESVYTLPGAGVITTWMYGPVPLWLWSPALLGSSALSAIMIADFVNIMITLVAIALTCSGDQPHHALTGFRRNHRSLARSCISFLTSGQPRDCAGVDGPPAPRDGFAEQCEPARMDRSSSHGACFRM